MLVNKLFESPLQNQKHENKNFNKIVDGNLSQILIEIKPAEMKLLEVNRTHELTWHKQPWVRVCVCVWGTDRRTDCSRRVEEDVSTKGPPMQLNGLDPVTSLSLCILPLSVTSRMNLGHGLKCRWSVEEETGPDITFLCETGDVPWLYLSLRLKSL